MVPHPRSRSRMPGRLGGCTPHAMGRRRELGGPPAAGPTPPLTRGVRRGLGEPPASAGGWGVTLTAAAAVLLALAAPVRAQGPAEFFEKKIRPVLVAHCLECHGTDPKK